MKYWGGGVVCAEMGWRTHAQVENVMMENELTQFSFGFPLPTCDGNGDTSEIYGKPEYIGLGFSVLVVLVLIEIFGSIFMKNCNVIIALLIGYLIAGVSNHDGADFVTGTSIESSKSITFLWVETFKIGFYAPAVIPMLIAYLVTTVETIGDITAVFDVSHLGQDGKEYEEAIQGGLTADALCSVLSGFFTSMPNTTFSQNNGVIALTKCASRRAGFACGLWLIFFGTFGKIADFITSIPDCVLGGMTIFLFSNVTASGISLTSKIDSSSRRNKFIMAMSLGVGIGVTIWPYAFLDRRASPYTAAFWTCADCNATMKGVRNGLSIFLSTGYCIGTVLAVILNSILPADLELNYEEQPKSEIKAEELAEAIEESA